MKERLNQFSILDFRRIRRDGYCSKHGVEEHFFGQSLLHNFND